MERTLALEANAVNQVELQRIELRLAISPWKIGVLWRGMPALGFFCLALWWGCTAWCQSTGVDQNLSTATRRAYPKVAKACAYDFSSELPKPEQSQDPAAFIALSKSVLLDLQELGDADPTLKAIASDVAQSVRTGLENFEIFRRAQPPPGLLNQMLNYSYYGLTGQFGQAEDYEKTIKNQSSTIRNAVLNFLEAVTQLQAAALLLPRVARTISGPPCQGRGLFDVDIDEGWGILQPDIIKLRNNSGRTLHNCTVVVSLVGAKGESRQNVHFVEVWPGDCTLQAAYEVGKEVLGRRFWRTSVTQIQEAGVVVFADEFTTDHISYQYVGREQDKDIARVLDTVFKPGSAYRPYSKGLIWDDQKAVQVSFSGLQYLHPGKLTVTLSNREKATTRRLRFDLWRAGTTKWLDCRDMTWDPTEWTILFEFDGTKVTRSYRWTR